LLACLLLFLSACLLFFLLNCLSTCLQQLLDNYNINNNLFVFEFILEFNCTVLYIGQACKFKFRWTLKPTTSVNLV
jgi:hypothetical protein